METITNDDITAALAALADMAARGEKAQQKFVPGTSQHTLQKNRIAALRAASALLAGEQGGRGTSRGFSKEELANAAAPLVSLYRKCEKARAKLAQESWQRAMLERNLRAISLVLPLLSRELGRDVTA